MKVLLLSTFLVFSHLLFLSSSSSSSSSSRVLFPSSTGGRSFVSRSFIIFTLGFAITESPKPAGTTGDDQTSSGDQHFPSQDDESLDNVIGKDNSGEGVLSEEEVEEGLGGFMEGRMVIQSNDYPGTGANNRHDPKPPTN